MFVTGSTWNSDTGSESKSSNDVIAIENQKRNVLSVAVIPNDAVIFKNKPNKLSNTGQAAPVIFNSCCVHKNTPDNEGYVLSVAGLPSALDSCSE